jgi:hypothetical protein
MDEIRAARPTPRPSAQDWAKGEGGRRVLERVAEAGGSGGRARWGTGSRIAIAAAVVVAVALALSLSLVYAGGGAHQPEVVDHPQTTVAVPGTAEPAGGVSRLSAVEHIMRLVFTRLSWAAESVGSSTTDHATLLDEAVAQGLISRSEITSESAAKPILEGEYALLLWTAFGPYLSLTTAPTSPVLGTTDPREKAAIQGLQAAGIFRESDGTFVSDRPLDGAREQLLLSRMEDALRGQASR